jgi:hypothetical protein
MSAEPATSSFRRQKVLGIVAVVALAAAWALYALRTPGRVEQPDTPDSASTYACLDCGHAFDLTPAGYVRLAEAGKVKSAEGQEQRGRRLVQCPQCRKFSATLSDKCPKDGTVIPRFDKHDKAGRCPKCGWTSIGI